MFLRSLTFPCGSRITRKSASAYKYEYVPSVKGDTNGIKIGVLQAVVGRGFTPIFGQFPGENSNIFSPLIISFIIYCCPDKDPRTGITWIPGSFSFFTHPEVIQALLVPGQSSEALCRKLELRSGAPLQEEQGGPCWRGSAPPAVSSSWAETQTCGFRENRLGHNLLLAQLERLTD